MPRPEGNLSPSSTYGFQTGFNLNTIPSQAGAPSAGASPTSSVGSNSVLKITTAQIYLLLSTIKPRAQDPIDYANKVGRLARLVNENGMDAFSKYFARLLVSNANQVFPGMRGMPPSNGNQGTYPILVSEMDKISHDPEQASKIVESIESGTEDMFRDFDLSTFMEHFKLDALEKTILALAFKLGSRSDLRTKADAILSTNFSNFLAIISQARDGHADLSDDFISLIIDRLIQNPPPNFNAAAKNELVARIGKRYSEQGEAAPSSVLATLGLIRVLAEKPPNALVLYMQRAGPGFTRDANICHEQLVKRPSNVQLSEEQVANALIYATVSQTPPRDPSILVQGLRKILSSTFRWQDVISYFDHREARISPPQLLRLYKALLPLAYENGESPLDIEHLWGGNWENSEAHLSFIGAFGSLTPDQLDARTIPGITPTINLNDYQQFDQSVKDRAAYAVRHPLVSQAALKAIFHVALASMYASQTEEAKRLFQKAVSPNLDVFLVSAIGVLGEWSDMAKDTVSSLFRGYLYKENNMYEDFVFESLWRKNRGWVEARLVDFHAESPAKLPIILDRAVKYSWLNQLLYSPNAFGLDLTAYAHAQGYINLEDWVNNNQSRPEELGPRLMQFLEVKANNEKAIQLERNGEPAPTPMVQLHIKTVFQLMHILQDLVPKPPTPDYTALQRLCITVYPRLVNYGEGVDDVIDGNGQDGNALSPQANARMEQHYKEMYSNEVQVRDIVETLRRYKHSRDPLEQDVFACMVQSLFEEYTHYADYPIQALATTSVLFGGIIARQLITGLPLQIALAMILESVRDHDPEDSMYKFGLQALIQLLNRLHEWPAFCREMLLIPGLRETTAWYAAEDALRQHETNMAANGQNGDGGHVASPQDGMTNGGGVDGAFGGQQPYVRFASVHADLEPLRRDAEDPDADTEGKIQFVLNNITETTLRSMMVELKELMQVRYQAWFAGHLVEERAKMQPNYHGVYLDLVDQFRDKGLRDEVVRETIVSVQRMLNSEATLASSSERSHLKNLGGWLGLLTLARDKPIKHNNIAFRDLLIEAFDTNRLIVVIPFVCKVLYQGASSTIFRPPNPWLMDIVHLLIDLYYHADLKLNLKFEIEVLCKGLDLDYKTIEPSGEFLNRVVEEPAMEIGALGDGLDAFESLSLNGLGPAMGGLSPRAPPPSIPDLEASLFVPPSNDTIIDVATLRDLINRAFTQALSDIIHPVVDRSVTIAAISTQQMIHKDFATEPDENKLRSCAINMVKKTAGSLALVTSKEPLRTNFTNYLRSMSAELAVPLPEGVILMCVNGNLDLASGVIQKSAEERAVPEIEDGIHDEIESRRLHREQRPGDPFVGSGLSGWASKIADPYKLTPNHQGLTAEQMSIYEEFARTRRAPPATTNAGGANNAANHMATNSDPSRFIGNEVLQDALTGVPQLPTPAATPVMPQMGNQGLAYGQAQQAGGNSNMTNGRTAQLGQAELRTLAERVTNMLFELQRVAGESPEEHFDDLPRSHPVIDHMDMLNQAVIKAQSSEDFVNFAVSEICEKLLSASDDILTAECFAHALEQVRKIGGMTASDHARLFFQQQDGARFLRLPMIAALLHTDLLDWRTIDEALARSIAGREAESVQLLDELVQLTILGETPMLLVNTFAKSLAAAYAWIREDSDVPGAQQLKATMKQTLRKPARGDPPTDPLQAQLEQFEYAFEEWVHLYRNLPTLKEAMPDFIDQMRASGSITTKDDLLLFIRVSLDRSVHSFEQIVGAGATHTEGYLAVDALTKFVGAFANGLPGAQSNDPTYAEGIFNAAWGIGGLLMNQHILQRGDMLNQKVFNRYFMNLLREGTYLAYTPEVAKNYLYKIASRLSDAGPHVYPGFAYGWLPLLESPEFLVPLLNLPDNAGWAPALNLITRYLDWLCEQIRPLEMPASAQSSYEAAIRLLFMVSQDFPEFVSATSGDLLRCIPSHCSQLINMILIADPDIKRPNPGHTYDRPESRKPAETLQQLGLLDLLQQVLIHGPTEDAVAHLKHAVAFPPDARPERQTEASSVNVFYLEALVAFLGQSAADEPSSADRASATLNMLVHEVSCEQGFFLATAIVNHLRGNNPRTQYFSQFVLSIFDNSANNGGDLDSEDETIREQYVRVMFQRIMGYWPQPWGLMVTVIELVKDAEGKYGFFNLPCLKDNPEVAQRFADWTQRHQNSG